MSDNLQDYIDDLSKSSIAKKRKLCTSGHINSNVRSNRTICDRQFCKEKLKESLNAVLKSTQIEVKKDTSNKDHIKARTYLNVPMLFWIILQKS